jgi:hypothetical protein
MRFRDFDRNADAIRQAMDRRSRRFTTGQLADALAPTLCPATGDAD